jgi:hypothetical protein
MVEEIKDYKIRNFTIPLKKISFYDNNDSFWNKICNVQYFNSNGKLHSVDFSLPSEEYFGHEYSVKIWHQNGQMISQDRLKPCFIRLNWKYNDNKTKVNKVETLEFSTNPKLTIVYEKEKNILQYSWTDNDGNYHRDDDKPGFIFIDNNRSNPKYVENYYKHGIRHRLCGPAIVNHFKNTNSWIFYGVTVTDILKPNIKSILSSHDINSKFFCNCCCNIFSDCTLPLECGHWIHLACFQKNKLKQCIDCNEIISNEHISFLKSVAYLFVNRL